MNAVCFDFSINVQLLFDNNMAEHEIATFRFWQYSSMQWTATDFLHLISHEVSQALLLGRQKQGKRHSLVDYVALENFGMFSPLQHTLAGLTAAPKVCKTLKKSKDFQFRLLCLYSSASSDVLKVLMKETKKSPVIYIDELSVFKVDFKRKTKVVLETQWHVVLGWRHKLSSFWVKGMIKQGGLSKDQEGKCNHPAFERDDP